MPNGIADPTTDQERVAQLKALGVHAAYHPSDLRHPEQIASMIDAATHAVERHFGAVENFLPEHWDKALAVNLSLPFHMIRLTLPGMNAKG